MFVLVVALSLAVVGCSAGADEAGAEHAVSQFHELFNSGQYVDLFEHSSPDLKKQATQEGFLALLDAVHRKLGNEESAIRQS